MDAASTFELVFVVFGESSLQEHVDIVDLRSGAEEWEIEEVAVERGHNRRLDVLNVREESLDRGCLDKLFI